MDKDQIINSIAIIIALLIVFILIPILGAWLWNTTLPVLFGITNITAWQFFKLMLLISCLFGFTKSAVESVNKYVKN